MTEHGSVLAKLPRTVWGGHLNLKDYRIQIFCLKAIVGASLLGILFSREEMGRAFQILRNIDPMAIGMTVSILFISYFLGGMRWAAILRCMGARGDVPAMTRIFWASAGLAQFFPSPFSDALRVGLASRAGIDLRTSLFSSLYERAVMIVALLLLAIFTAPAVLPAHWQSSFFAVAGMLLLGAAVGCLLTAYAAPLLPVRSPMLRDAILKMSAELRVLMLPRNHLPIAANAIASHANMMLAALLLGMFMSLPIPAIAYAGIMPLVVLSMVLPISISGWGVREGLLVVLLVPLGVGEAEALAFSLLFGLCVTASSLPGLVYLIVKMGRTSPAAPQHK